MKRHALYNLSRGMMVAMSGWLLAACSPADHSPLAPSFTTSSIVEADTLLSAGFGQVHMSKGGTSKDGRPKGGTSNGGTSKHGLADEVTSVITLNRLVPLMHDVVGSAVIGKEGGVLSLPEAGVTLVVPKGAVDSAVTFRITALAGHAVAYEFEPHGVRFKKALRLKQELGLTGFNNVMHLSGGYFLSRDEIDQASGSAKVHETLKATLKRGDLLLDLWHFSGYLVSMA